jgi:hypothetical protein
MVARHVAFVLRNFSGQAMEKYRNALHAVRRKPQKKSPHFQAAALNQPNASAVVEGCQPDAGRRHSCILLNRLVHVGLHKMNLGV